LRAHAESAAREFKEEKRQGASGSTKNDAIVTDAEVKSKEVYTITDPVTPPVVASSSSRDNSDSKETTAGESTPPGSGMDLQNEGLYANQMSPALMAKRVSGIITNERGDPLTGANLSIQNTNLGTMSDAAGRFELFLPASESVIDVTYSGYIDASLTMRQGEEDIIITLPEQDHVQQQVTMMEKSDSRSASNVPAGRAYNTTRPREEPEDFISYLKSNTRFPLDETGMQTSRQVMLSFEITSKGRPEKLTVTQSSGNKQLDEEALRLIRRGPDWNCELDLYPCQGTYTIYFR
jgi:TonB family protein